MRTHRPQQFYRPAAYVPPPLTQAGVAKVGMNLSDMQKSRGQWYINIVLGQAGFQPTDGSSTHLPESSPGSPQIDFRFWSAEIDTNDGPARTLKGRFGGYVDTINVYRRYSVANKVYDAAANVTTFDLIDPAGAGSVYYQNPCIEFVGTRRTGGATGASNTGVTNLEILLPGHTHAEVAAGKVWTDEAVAFVGRFGRARMMDCQPVLSRPDTYGVNNDTDTTWDGPTRKTSQSQSFGELMALANAANVSPSFCIGALWTDAAVREFATWAHGALASGLSMGIAYSNETWNSGTGFPANGLTHDLAIAEVKGARGGQSYLGFNVTRTNNVVTITRTEPHGWVAGHTLYLYEFMQYGGYRGPVTLTTASGTTATFTLAGPDIAAGTTAPYYSHVLYDMTSTLCAWDQCLDLEQLQQRYCIRRAMQISEIFRSVVGDANMGTRVKVLWEDHMELPPASFLEPVLQYLQGAFPQRAVGQRAAGSNGAYFTGYAGGPYFSATNNTAGITVDDVGADLLAAARSATDRYFFEQRILMAATYGLEAEWYESGADTTGCGGLLDPDQQLRVKAQFLPPAGAAQTAMMAAWVAMGGGMMNHFYAGFGRAEERGFGTAAWGNFARSLSDVTSPKAAALAAAPSLVASRNVLAAVSGQSVTLTTATSEGRNGAELGPGAWDNYRMLLLAPSDGNYALTYTYSNAGSGNRIQVYVGQAAIGSAFAMVTNNVFPFPDHSTPHTSPTYTLALKKGPNVLRLRSLDDSGGRATLDYRTLTLVRL